MKVLTEGHLYVADNYENPENGQIIQFIEKAEVDGVFQTINDGTTIEEIIKILVTRLSTFQEKFPCKENACAITHLQEAENWLDRRTKDRIARGVKNSLVK